MMMMNISIIIIISIISVKSLPHNFTHKLHVSKSLWAPWRWPTAEAETCRNNNQQIKILCIKLVLGIGYIR